MPESSVNAAKFSSLARCSVSKRPIWVAEAACLSTALPPTIQRMAGSRAKTVGVVHVFIAAKASKHRLTKQPSHAMPSIFAGTAALEKTPGNLAQAKGIVKLPIGEQSGVRCDPGTVELQLQATVEIDPQVGVFDSPVG